MKTQEFATGFQEVLKCPSKKISKPFEVINYSDIVLSMNLNTTM